MAKKLALMEDAVLALEETFPLYGMSLWSMPIRIGCWRTPRWSSHPILNTTIWCCSKTDGPSREETPTLSRYILQRRFEGVITL
ncbi:hypothetical protein C2W62_25025 [Candidatus Entotheonella serta]|nr:hypothetical protein C2W62_25025 [Candidatus Entotheonella serta]